MNPKIVTKGIFTPFKGLSNNSPSLTIPDQAMSLKTILERHARGMPITGTNYKPLYQVDNEVPMDFHTWDLAEREEYTIQKRYELQELQAKFKAEQAAKKASEARNEPPDGTGDDGGKSPAIPKEGAGGRSKPADKSSDGGSDVNKLHNT